MERSLLRTLGMVLGTTIGAGIFALPYVFARAGYVLASLYLFVLPFVIFFCHYVYVRVLEHEEKARSLVGLVKDYLGKPVSRISDFAIIGGLALSLVVYIILGAEFIRILLPDIAYYPALLVFWLIGSLPLLIRGNRLLSAEVWGSVLMVLLIFWIYLMNPGLSGIMEFPAVNGGEFFLPFGAVLFSLAAWTAVEPVFYSWRRNITRAKIFFMGLGSLIAAALYFVFVLGIANFGSITPDTISGLHAWPRGLIAAMSLFGLFAIWTSYVPASLEIKNSLLRDMRWKKRAAVYFVLFLPLALIALGFNNFVQVIGLAGGLFLSMEYVFILLLGKKRVKFRQPALFAINALLVLFVLAAAFEVYYFLR